MEIQQLLLLDLNFSICSVIFDNVFGILIFSNFGFMFEDMEHVELSKSLQNASFRILTIWIDIEFEGAF